MHAAVINNRTESIIARGQLLNIASKWPIQGTKCEFKDERRRGGREKVRQEEKRRERRKEREEASERERRIEQLPVARTGHRTSEMPELVGTQDACDLRQRAPVRGASPRARCRRQITKSRLSASSTRLERRGAQRRYKTHDCTPRTCERGKGVKEHRTLPPAPLSLSSTEKRNFS